jgi:hypothetical protein
MFELVKKINKNYLKNLIDERLKELKHNVNHHIKTQTEITTFFKSNNT